LGLVANTQRRISAKERETIHAGLAQGKSGAQLAALLGRDASVVNRDIAPNGGRKAYSSVVAQACALSSAQARQTQQNR
jgi:IS30 family transposase